MDLQRNTVKSHMMTNKFKNILNNIGIHQVVIGIVLFFIVYSFVASSIIPKKYNLSVGDIATDDIPSPKDVENNFRYNRLVEEAVRTVGKVYVIDYSIKDEAVKTVKDFFSKVNEIRYLQTLDMEIRLERLKSESVILLAEDDFKTALNANAAELKTLQDYMIKNLEEILSQEIASNDKDLKSKQDEFASNIKRNLKLDNGMRNLGIDIGFVLIKPNMVYNSKETEERVKEAKDSVPKVKIKKGQNIVEKGKEVTQEQIEILDELGLLEQQKKIDFLLYIGIGILLAILEGLVIAYLYRFSPNILKDRSRLFLLSLIITLLLLLTKFASVYGVSGFIIPMAFASMLVSILIKPRLALVLNIVLSAVVTLMTGNNMDVFIIALIGGSVGAVVVYKMHQRNDLLRAGIIVSLANTLSILAVGLISSADIKTVFLRSIMGIVNGCLSSIFTIGLLPFCETTFDIVTPIKLLELSNPNQPLMKKLLYEAPGTYHHSVIVGNLSEAAVDAIGGNSLLARVGSYYHDVGKIKRPYFFKENQLTHENPHDKITPSLSTLIITNHVKDGVELAKKYKLPTIVKDMIEQHHGSTLVKYFYIKAVNGCDSHEEVAENQFRYSNPKPKTKEAAVVLMADSVEAAVRSIPSPTKTKIEEMVRKIVKDKLDDGQLDECDLTLKEINQISLAFLNVLNGIYHDRIEYPDDDIRLKGGCEDESDDRK